MARPTVIRTEVILDAARAVFLERGILATSAEVAQRAGVSEGSIFKRFKTKAELFRAAMGLDLDDMPKAIAALGERVGQGSVDENLVMVGLDAASYYERIMPILMMAWSNPKVGDCMPFPADVEAPPVKAQRLVSEYLVAERALGRVAESVDPVVIARAFMGAISSYVYLDMFARDRGLVALDRSAYLRSFVQTLWAGMGPSSAQLEAPRSAPRARVAAG